MKFRSTISAVSLAASLVLAACNGVQADSSTLEQGVARPYKTGALIFQNESTATGDAEAIASILKAHNVTYKIVGTDEMDAMTQEQMAEYGMIVWPGGYAGRMSEALQKDTRDRLAKVVNETGVSFVGFCAGAFIAVSPDTSWGLSIIDGETLPYYHLEDEGTPAAMVDVTMADGKQRHLLWWGGPYLPDYPKGVVARYDDTKQAAIAQNWAGNGLVIISGPHPEAPENWRSKLGLEDKDGSDQDIAWAMFDAALKRQPMATLN